MALKAHDSKLEAASIGQAVRQARKAAGLSQSSFGELLRLNQKTISAIENGAEGTAIGTVLAVLAQLGLAAAVGDNGAPRGHLPKRRSAAHGGRAGGRLSARGNRGA
jgi:transcriptional regulator with XRE-family HTH domain